MREPMLGIFERLNPAASRRIYRSHIINVHPVKKFLPCYGGGYLVMMKDGSKLTLSRNYRDALEGMLHWFPGKSPAIFKVRDGL